MTGKRFKVTDNTDNPFLCDWSVTDYADGGIVHHPMTSENMANVMCDLLNEQHETIERLNQQLRIFSDGLKAEIRETKEVFEDYSECVDEKKQLKEKNEQLRTALKELKEIGDYQSERINELSDENEQLKEEIKELKIDNIAKDDAIDGLQSIMAHYDLEDLE